MKFSVIIPVYNKADTLPAAIGSVLAQTVKDAELIIVDDGSTDRIGEVLSRYDGLRVIHQENGGVSAARNTGIAQAKGEYLCFLDADDEWRPEHLETICGLMETYPEAGYFLTGHEETTARGEVRHSSHALSGYGDHFLCDDLLGLLNQTSYGIIHTNSVCVKKSILQADGIWFEPGAAIGEDTDVWYRLALRHPAAVSMRETTVYHRESSTATKQTSHTFDWVFCRREEEIMADGGIREEVKRSASQLLDRYKLTGCRVCMVRSDRAQAIKILKTVRNRRGRRYVLTRIFCGLPYGLCRALYRRRMGGA